MALIDSVILRLTERACRRFQRLTGRTNVWLAAQLTNLSIIVYFVWAGLYSVTIDPVLRTVAALFGVGDILGAVRLRAAAGDEEVAGLHLPRVFADAVDFGVGNA